MIPQEILNSYSNRLGNALQLSSKPEQIVPGCMTALSWLKGCLGPNTAVVDGKPLNRHIKLVQVFRYKNHKMMLEVGYYLSVMNADGTRDWRASEAVTKEMKDDENLKDNLCARELLISYKGVEYKYDPSEQILLGEEPCLVELPPPESK
jgi:hypothetical protein